MLKIKRYILTQSVTIYGRNVWGFNSHIIFSPATDTGWYLYDPKEDIEMPLNCQNMKDGKNNLFAQNGRSKMHVLEHILSLRWMGLDMTRIYGSSWPPYLTTKEMWDVLANSGYLRETDEEIPILRVMNPASYQCKTSKVIRSTSITPCYPQPFRNGFDNVRIDVSINYTGVGKLDMSYALSNFESISEIYPQGFPKYRYFVCKVLELVLGWPHVNRVIWARGRPNTQTLIKWADHRALDILGCLAAIDHKALPSDFEYGSNRGGHKFDLITIKKLKHS